MKKVFQIVSVIGFVLVTTEAAAMTDEEKQEIAFASEAAPNHITDSASFVMFRDGKFQTIEKGSNDFTCLVVRNPNGRFEPACLNKPAIETVLPTLEYHTARLYAGASTKQVMREIAKKFEMDELPTAKVGALVYMMSKNNQAYLEDTDKLISFPPHQMYFMPKLSADVFSLAESTFSPGSPWLYQEYPHMSCLIVFTK
ncbi:chromate transporter [Alteromonas antoniana]|uniref:chromate transporter n=1 Tax=Alteromonas antoniana TaxID=2803813 RepID=UPI001C444CE1|nr:chromate transporter [Alteromonas antoniana]